MLARRVSSLFSGVEVKLTSSQRDEKNSRDSLKQAFEERFPGITLNITVDLSKYHDTNVSIDFFSQVKSHL